MSTLPRFTDRYASAAIPATMNSPTPSSIRRPIALPALLALPLVLDRLLLDLAVDEPAHGWVGGALDLLRPADGVDPPLVEHSHAIGDLEDLRDLVTDHDGCEAELSMKADDQMMDGVDEDRVEPGRRLVEKDH